MHKITRNSSSNKTRNRAVRAARSPRRHGYRSIRALADLGLDEFKVRAIAESGRDLDESIYGAAALLRHGKVIFRGGSEECPLLVALLVDGDDAARGTVVAIGVARKLVTGADGQLILESDRTFRVEHVPFVRQIGDVADDGRFTDRIELVARTLRDEARAQREKSAA
ncbi:MAG: hypothetical protein ACHREM_13805 [Polyangiales bacterium]